MENTSESMKEMSEKVMSNVQDISDDFSKRAQRIASDVRDRAGDYYDEASDWLKENYGKTLLTVGILAAVGIAGYYLAKSRSTIRKT